jgi:catechol 2,3-dioxygenase-like lactoylglutathione lyase family enzyme
MVRNFDHVTIVVRDVEVAKRFYENDAALRAPSIVFNALLQRPEAL